MNRVVGLLNQAADLVFLSSSHCRPVFLPARASLLLFISSLSVFSFSRGSMTTRSSSDLFLKVKSLPSLSFVNLSACDIQPRSASSASSSFSVWASQDLQD